jgi:hypothetical protein
LHFYGHFKFQVPVWNNNTVFDARTPKENEPPTFDPTFSIEKVQKKLYCDPADYFKFKFTDDVKVSRVTYNDASHTVKSEDDDIIGKHILLQGFLSDISPRLIYGRFYPIVDEDIKGLEIVDSNDFPILSGIPSNRFKPNDISFSLQSDLRTIIRTDRLHEDLDNMFKPSAYFHMKLYNVNIQNNILRNSRFIGELGNPNELEFYFHVSRFKSKTHHTEGAISPNEGDVCGYICHITPTTNNAGSRIKSRRLVIDPKISSTIKNDFKITDRDYDGLYEQGVFYDLDGSYDIFENERLFMLRYMDFLPFVKLNEERREYSLPDEYKYAVQFVRPDGQPIEVENGKFELDYRKMQTNGGIDVFKLPDGVLTNDEVTLIVQVIKNGNIQTLMIEPGIDFVLESERGIVMGSRESYDIFARIYKRNRKASEHPFVLSTIEPPNSPTAAYFQGTLEIDSEGKPKKDPKNGKFIYKEKELKTTSEGEIRGVIQAIDLESERVYDPITSPKTGDVLNLKDAWDRHFGNFVFIKIKKDVRDNNSNILYEVKIPVRVLHVTNPDTIPINELSFSKHIKPLFDYYIRYYPWLHTKKSDSGYYEMIFDISDPNIVRDKFQKIVDRLRLKDTKKNKMPRSHDFPIKGDMLIERWKDAGWPD